MSAHARHRLRIAKNHILIKYIRTQAAPAPNHATLASPAESPLVCALRQPRTTTIKPQPQSPGIHMPTRRRTMLARILVSLLLFTIAGFASAQAQYPAKPMRMIIPYPPGGGTDILGRPIAKLFGDKLGQQVRQLAMLFMLAWLSCIAHRAVGRGQEHAGAAAAGVRLAGRGGGAGRRTRHPAPARQRSARALRRRAAGDGAVRRDAARQPAARRPAGVFRVGGAGAASWRASTRRSRRCRAATPPRSASGAPASRAGSGSGSRSPARCSSGRGSWCSTRPPPASTRRWPTRSRPPSTRSRAA